MITSLRRVLPAVLLGSLLSVQIHASSPVLDKAGAEAEIRKQWEELRGRELDARRKELDAKELTAAGVKIRFTEHIYGDAPEGGHSLWISMHGGGGTTAEVNEQQYRNQQRLYPAKEGIWVIPRSPNDVWNMWHEPHIDAQFDRFIENYIIVHGVNPNRVYLLGYSAGGDGVYQLAPRTADRYAAASMMAGHPNDASPLGLRNLPFAIFMGGRDGAYKRNEHAAEWKTKLEDLRASDPNGYEHWVQIYPDLGHWMKLRDAEALPWMAEKTRNPWPMKVAWCQDDVLHSRFYWLAVPKDSAAAGQKITALVEGQTIKITTEEVNQLELRLHDRLINLDEPITVLVNGEQRFRGRVERRLEAIQTTLAERADPETAAMAILPLKW